MELYVEVRRSWVFRYSRFLRLLALTSHFSWALAEAGKMLSPSWSPSSSAAGLSIAPVQGWTQRCWISGQVWALIIRQKIAHLGLGLLVSKHPRPWLNNLSLHSSCLIYFSIVLLFPKAKGNSGRQVRQKEKEINPQAWVLFKNISYYMG